MKIPSRQLLPSASSSDRRAMVRLRYLRVTLLPLLLLCAGLTACSTASTHKITFANPPQTGEWLRAQRELYACETKAAARYMADFGFVHVRCSQLDQIGDTQYRVVGRQRVQLKEGPLWLIRVKRDNQVYWVPVPWHDWV